MDKSHLKTFWDEQRNKNRIIRDMGCVMITVKQTRIHVICPFNEGFRTRAVEIGGRWRHRSEVWTFPLRALRLVKELAVEIFGKEAIR